MKIIVDSTPKEPKECLFSSKRYYGNYVCKFQGECIVCNTQKCNYLQAITDFHAVEDMGNNLARMIPIE